MNLQPLIDELKQEEGFSPVPYQDSKGVWTIGYGTNISKISEDEAAFFLQHRMVLAATDVLNALPWSHQLDDVRFNVLVDMAYNMGIGELLKFHHTLAAVERGDWAGAHDGMLDSQWASEVGLRATRLAEMMLNGK